MTPLSTPPDDPGGVTSEDLGSPPAAGSLDTVDRSAPAAVTAAVAAAAPEAAPEVPETPLTPPTSARTADQFALPFSTPTNGETPGLIDGTIVALYSILGLGTAVLAGRALRGRDRRLVAARADAERVTFE